MRKRAVDHAAPRANVRFPSLRTAPAETSHGRAAVNAASRRNGTLTVQDAAGERQAVDRRLTGRLGIPAPAGPWEDRCFRETAAGRGGVVFSETVRAYRQRLGITQEELASLAGVSVRSIREL